MKNRRLLAISSLFLATTISAGAARRAAANTEVDPGTAFSRLKALVGDWDVESSQGKAHSRFELIAGGSVLLEHFTEPPMAQFFPGIQFTSIGRNLASTSRKYQQSVRLASSTSGRKTIRAMRVPRRAPETMSGSWGSLTPNSYRSMSNTIVQLFQAKASVLMVPSGRFGNSTASICQFGTDCISKAQHRRDHNASFTQTTGIR
jgi:hypothetical protein